MGGTGNRKRVRCRACSDLAERSEPCTMRRELRSETRYADELGSNVVDSATSQLRSNEPGLALSRHELVIWNIAATVARLGPPVVKIGVAAARATTRRTRSVDSASEREPARRGYYVVHLERSRR